MQKDILADESKKTLKGNQKTETKELVYSGSSNKEEMEEPDQSRGSVIDVCVCVCVVDVRIPLFN